MQCDHCDDEIPEMEDMLAKLAGKLCQSCRLDQVLDDLMLLNTEHRTSVAREAMNYPGVAAQLASNGDFARITGGLLGTKGLFGGN